MAEPSETTLLVAELARAEYAEFLRQREITTDSRGNPFNNDFMIKRSLHRFDGMCLALAHLLVKDGVIEQSKPTDIDGFNWLFGRPQEN